MAEKIWKTERKYDAKNLTLDEASRIISENNVMADIMERADFQAILAKEKKLRGEEVKTGGIVCIDGRLPTIHIFGRTTNIWEEPASLFPEESGRLRSPRFTEHLRMTAKGERELLEFVTCHRSGATNHHCGRVMGGQKPKESKPPEFDPNKSPVEVARELIIQQTIPLVEKRYTDLELSEKGHSSRHRTTVPIEIDTDTLGLELLTPDGKDGLSTNKFAIENRLFERIEQFTGEHWGSFGKFKETFTEPKYFLEYYRAVVDLSEALIGGREDIYGLKSEIQKFLNINYQDQYSPAQQQAIIFTLARSLAMQYMTGLGKGDPHHAFAHHEEVDRMALSLSGKTIGRHSPNEQIFGSTPSTPEEACKDVVLKMSILDGNPNSSLPYILFISEPVDSRMWKEYQESGENETVVRALGSLSGLHDVLTHHNEIKKRIDDTELVIIPVLVDENSGKVLKQCDFDLLTAY